MKYRGPLVLLALVSGAGAAVLGLLLSPVVVVLLRDKLHIGCTLSSQGPDQPREWLCQDGIGLVVPGLMFVAAIAGVIFTVGVVGMIRRLVRQGAGPDSRRAVAKDLGLLGAAPLVLQAPVSAYAALSASYSDQALSLGLLVGVAGLLPFVAARAHAGLYAAACLAAAAMALLVTGRAVLLAPFIIGCVSLLLCAATVSILGLLRIDGLPARGNHENPVR